MVKRKSLPKPRLEAGFAARNEQPVNDTTIADDSDIEESETSTEPATNSKPTIIKPTTSRAVSAAAAQQKGNKFANKSQFKAKTKPGIGALREIKRLQSSTAHVIPRAPFLRVVNKIYFLINQILKF